MKKLCCYGCVLLLAVAACEKKPAAESSGKEPSASPARTTNAESPAAEVKLDPSSQKRIGLEIAALRPATVSPELKAYGRVLNVSGLVSLVAEWTTVRAASEASQAELARLKNLAAQNNAAERTVQAAQATAIRDQASVQATRLKLISDWGTALASREDLAELVQALASFRSALVQLDLPVGAGSDLAPTGARVFPLGDETNALTAILLGPAPAVDAQLQGRGFWFLVQTNLPPLAPGTAVTGWITLPGSSRTGVLVPSPAIIRHNGLSWVYLQSSESTFQRRPVFFERPLQNGWFISAGLKPGDQVVIVGAQQLLSQEANTPEE